MALVPRYSPRATRELNRVPQPDKERIVQRIEAYLTDPDARSHDVRPLHGMRPGLRLRVGNWRVLFDRIDDEMSIERIADRKEIYR